MQEIIGVKFRNASKVYYFDPKDLDIHYNDHVIVETVRGIEFGTVVLAPMMLADDKVPQPLREVLRIADAQDVERETENRIKEKEAFKICRQKILERGLEMKLIQAEYTFDNSKVLFYFTADGRIDFRDLVKDLAGIFRTRIELRQIGVRDETKILGGIGICGRPLCCHTYLSEFAPVSIKMAKEQNLSLNPTKISGQCGRLMCCLKYEQDNYEQVLKRVPRVGKDIVTPDGVGVITEINAIKERIKVRIRVDDDSFDVREYAIDEVRRPGPGDAAAVREAPKADRRRARPQPESAPEEENAEDETKKKRYPHQKAPKNLSTEQFLEKLKETGGAMPAHPGQHRRRRSRGGRSGEGAPAKGETPAPQAVDPE